MNTKVKATIAVLSAAAISLSVLAGCGSDSGSGGSSGSTDSKASSTQSADSGGSGGTLNLVYGGHTIDYVTTDPAVQYTGAQSVSLGTCETLTVLSDDGSTVEPWLAKEWKQVDDTTREFTLEDGIKFHNGKEMTGEKVAAALEYVGKNNPALTVKIVSAKAKGQVVTVKTEGPAATLPRFLTGGDYIVFDTDEKDLAHGLVGTGPFKFDNFASNGDMTSVRYDDYWKGTPKLDKILMKGSVDQTSTTMPLQSGEIDVSSGVATSDLPIFENDSNFNIQEYTNSRVYYLYLNESYGDTKDAKLREALTYAFDRDSIVQGIYNGYATPTTSIYEKGTQYYDEATQQHGFDKDKAISILDEAGYKDSDGDGIREKDGKNIKLNITTYDANQFPKLCEALQQMLKDIGIDSEVKISDAIMDDLGKCEFNIATYGYNTLTYGDSQNYLVPVFKSGQNSNFIKYKNDKVDKLLTELETTADEARRTEITKEVQKEIYPSNDYVHLLHIKQFTVTNAKLKNYDATPFSGYRAVKHNWEIYKES